MNLLINITFGAGAFKAAVGVAYENELGRVANAHNKARVANTSADLVWFKRWKRR